MIDFLKKKKNILVVGCNGMLGHDVMKHFTDIAQIKGSKVGTVVGIDYENGVDLADIHSVERFFSKSTHFDYCINCAAYTNTRDAEYTSNGFKASYLLNAIAPKNLANVCKANKTYFIHISTDYVFSEHCYGNMKCFYDTSIPFPYNTYGMHKLIGEQMVQNEFGCNNNYAILRASWLYGNWNTKSFVHKFLKNCKLAAESGTNEVNVTSDEYSVPTSCACVIDCIDTVMRNKKIHGVLNAVPLLCQDASNDRHIVSRYDFAKAILRMLSQLGCHTFDNIVIKETKLDDNCLWPHHSSMISSFNGVVKHWTNYLSDFLTTIVDQY